MDPLYRTIEGFCILIENEFMLYGHQFNSRLLSKDENSPIFIQFLDAVRVIMEQNLEAFEFNDIFLKDLGSAYYDNRFYNFVCDGNMDYGYKQGLDLWKWMGLKKDLHMNCFY